MHKFVIQGGKPLKGVSRVSGAKNSALPLLFSTLLAEGTHCFENVPDLHDIKSTNFLLQSLGCRVEEDFPILRVNCQDTKSFEAHYDIVRKMRASILCLGPLLARYGQAIVSLPGGCAIGTRPIDLHLDVMTALGAEVVVEHGYVRARAKRLQGTDFTFKGVTVGGTENALMAASLAQGITTLRNCAREPEIVDLIEYLNKMGAKIRGVGSDTIHIEGVERLTPSQHTVMPDRIEAATLLLAGAITGGEINLTGCRPGHLVALCEKLSIAGLQIETTDSTVSLRSPTIIKGVNVETAPYPGFATDIQAQYMALMTVAHGDCQITETIFENRFMHVQELVRLGADISLKGQVAFVRGRPGGLRGAPVMATDLRASACLVLAGLAARGETIVNRIYHLDRGYEQLERKLNSLGASVRREPA